MLYPEEILTTKWMNKKYKYRLYVNYDKPTYLN